MSATHPSKPRAGDRLGRLYAIAAAILAALVPLILLAGLWIRTELTEDQQDLDTLLRGQASSLSQRLDAQIHEQVSVLQAVAAMPNLDQPDLAQFHATATRMVAAMPQWMAIGLVEPASGRQVLNTQRPLGVDLPETTTPEVVRRVAESRRFAVHTRAPTAGALTGGHTVLVYVPVIRDDAVRHVLVAGMRAETVQAVLANRETGDARLLTVVVDEQDRVLARSRAPEQFIGRPVNEALRGPTMGRREGSLVASTLDGQEVYTAFQRSDLTGWMAVAATDLEQFAQPSRLSTFATAAALILAVTLAGVLGVFLFHTVVQRRISDERFAASRALGDLDARLLATTQEALAEQRKAAQEREVLLREIYHRVKNNLQIIQSLLRLGSRDLKAEQREPFESAIRRIGAMARIHTLLYNSPDLASVDFREYLDGLARETADAFAAEERGIEVAFDAGPMRVPLDTAVPLAFIAVEILTNAFKHAFPDGRGGTVTVTAHPTDGDRGILVIADDGVGLPPRGSGIKGRLGLTIIDKLVQQIDGTLERPEAGTSAYRIGFPLKADGPPAPGVPEPAGISGA